MLTQDFLDRVEELFELDDILYTIGRDRRWLIEKMRDEIIEHKDDFFQGDEYYSEITDD